MKSLFKMPSKNGVAPSEVQNTTPANRALPLSAREKESRGKRFMVFIALLPPIVTTILLVLALLLEWKIEGGSRKWIDENRATTQILVQIISVALGLWNVFSIKKIINFSSRLALYRQPMRLETLKLLSAISSDNVDMSLRGRNLPIMALFSALFLFPAALWAGALTPVDSSAVRSNFETRSPAYSDATVKNWNETWYNYQGPKVRNSLGVFSYAPPVDRYGYLHSDGSAASTPDGSPPLHAKNDNSNFTYIGRSYGVGSLVGLNKREGLNLARGVLGYSFHESGYLPHVHCIYNETSDFHLTLVVNSTDPAIPYIYNANGGAPPAKVEKTTKHKRDFTVVGFGEGDVSVVAIAQWHYGLQDTGDWLWYYAFATGDNYAQLNDVQCRVTARAAEFKVNVDLQLRTITAQLLDMGKGNAWDIEPTGSVMDLCTQTVGGLSMIDQSYYTSVLGDMFLNSKFIPYSSFHMPAYI